jgi:hypothetical protein
MKVVLGPPNMRAMPSNPRRPDAPPARVCIVSLRGINKHAAWCSNYEFEDVIAGVDDVDVYSLEPGTAYEQRQWFARRMIWKPGLRRLSPFLNPGCRKITLAREYDLFVFVCMNPSDLIYLSAVEGWKNCRKRVCYMVEFYAGWTREYAYHLSLLKDFDFVTQSFSSCIAAVRYTPLTIVSWLAAAAVPVALNSTGVRLATTALACCDPACVPSVQLACARPAASVTELVGVNDPKVVVHCT